MKVHFSKSFLKDINKVKDKNLKGKVKNVILELESCLSVQEIKDIKKPKGHTSAYRLEIQNYRLGFYINNNEIIVRRFVKRNDIYKVLP